MMSYFLFAVCMLSFYPQVLTTLLVPPQDEDASAPLPDKPFAVRLWPHKAPNGDDTFETSDATDPLNRPSCRPDFAVLVYPVVTMGEQTHGGSRTNLLGTSPSQELIDLFSNEKHVTDQTPPMFLTHAVDDGAVPCINSKALFDALQAAKIRSRYLELPSGGHGLNGYKGPMWEAWQQQSLEWLAEQ